jgi:divalent metal cation (Fe/Co/Zn/Cd) transporter
MSLGEKLAVVFLAFLTILTIVIWLAFRERRIGKSIDSSDLAAQQASDSRVLFVVFGAIFGGMFLTIIVAWLVFF